MFRRRRLAKAAGNDAVISVSQDPSVPPNPNSSDAADFAAAPTASPDTATLGADPDAVPWPTRNPQSPEHVRLGASDGANAPWRLWGPYVSGRQWGTVREDYSADGNAWASFPFDQAHARAYRWGEDGLGAICDRFGFLNFGVALWNGKDPVLKERLFGLTNEEGNHGEDAKEYWWAVDGTPTHSWMQWLYRYPQAEYPYRQLREENARRGRDDREYELGDTGILDDDRFFDMLVSYAKAESDDICVQISITNQGPETAPLDVLPQLWLRNTWAWGRDARHSMIHQLLPPTLTVNGLEAVECTQGFLGKYFLAAEGDPEALFCNNETNAVAVFGAAQNTSRFTKDGINNRVVNGTRAAVNPALEGTKAAFWYHFDSVEPGQSVTLKLRLSKHAPHRNTFGADFTALFQTRRGEADEFYAHIIHPALSEADRHVARRAYAGLLWGKQAHRN